MLLLPKDADRLDAIGAIGIARTFTFGGARKRPLHDPSRPLATCLADVAVVEADAYAAKAAGVGAHAELTYDHFFDKLIKLKGLMRNEFMEGFLHQMRREIGGEA